MTTNDGWECPICAYANDFTTYRCGLCNTIRSESTTNSQVSVDGQDASHYHQMTAENSTNTTSPSSKLKSKLDKIAAAIVTDNASPFKVLQTLKSVCKKCLRDDPRYHKLDLQNPRVIEKLLAFEHVLKFLNELGFEPNENNDKLIYNARQSINIVHTAIQVLNSFLHQLETGIIIAKKKVSNTNKVINAITPETELKTADLDEKKDDNINSGGGININIDASIANIIAQSDIDTERLKLEEIVKRCTDESSTNCNWDRDSIETLIVTHKQYCKSIDLLTALRNRYFVSPPLISNSYQIDVWKKDTRMRIQNKVITGLKEWIKKYWNQDFQNNDDNIIAQLDQFIDEIKNKTPDSPFGKLLEIHVNKYRKLNSVNVDTYDDDDDNDGRYRRKVRLDSSLQLSTFDFDKIDWDSIEYDQDSNISSVSARIIADQITLLHFDIFRKIDARECVGKAWKQKNRKEIAANIVKIEEFSKNIVKFGQMKVFSNNSVVTRACEIRRIIEMGRRFEELNNIDALYAVYCCLNLVKINEKRQYSQKMWSEISPEDKEYFNKIKDIFDPRPNHRNLSRLHRCVAAPGIPYIGIVLQNLAFIENASTSVDRSYGKYLKLMNRIKFLQRFQNKGYLHPDANKLNKQQRLPLENNGRKADNLVVKPDLKVMKMILDQFDCVSKLTHDQIWQMTKSNS